MAVPGVGGRHHQQGVIPYHCCCCFNVEILGPNRRPGSGQAASQCVGVGGHTYTLQHNMLRGAPKETVQLLKCRIHGKDVGWNNAHGHPLQSQGAPTWLGVGGLGFGLALAGAAADASSEYPMPADRR